MNSYEEMKTAVLKGRYNTIIKKQKDYRRYVTIKNGKKVLDHDSEEAGKSALVSNGIYKGVLSAPSYLDISYEELLMKAEKNLESLIDCTDFERDIFCEDRKKHTSENNTTEMEIVVKKIDEYIEKITKGEVDRELSIISFYTEKEWVKSNGNCGEDSTMITFLMINLDSTDKNGKDISIERLTGWRGSAKNAYSVSLKGVDIPLIEIGAFDEIIENTNFALHYYEKAVTDISTLIIMPDALEKILKLLISACLDDRAVLSKKSIWLNKLGEKVIDDRISLSAVYDKNGIVSSGRLISSKGIVNRNAAIIEKGVLRHFCLSEDVESQMGYDHSYCDFGFLCMEGGNEAYKNKLSETESGLIISRIQTQGLDYYGNLTLMIKNGVVVENGIEKGTIGTICLKVNLEDLFNNIVWISKDIACSGNSALPWIAVDRNGFSIH